MVFNLHMLESHILLGLMVSEIISLVSVLLLLFVFLYYILCSVL